MINFNEWILLKESKEAKIPNDVKRKINTELSKLGRTYHRSIPIREIDSTMGKFNVKTSDSGYLLAGRDSGDRFDLLFNDMPVSNSMLILAWHKMPESGNWEITAYLS